MTIGLKQGSVVTEIGPGAIFHSLFSTVAVHLEGGEWGSRYPLIMEKLYRGSLSATDVVAAIKELAEIKAGLASLPPDQVVWDIDNPSKEPPWGRAIGPHVRSVAEYYVTTSGRNVLSELLDNLESLKEFGGTLDVIPYQGASKA